MYHFKWQKYSNFFFFFIFLNFYIFQRIYQLLPPPYRDVWLEWQDADNKQKDLLFTISNVKNINLGGLPCRWIHRVIYQLLPPPYRDVWLEWQNADNKQKDLLFTISNVKNIPNLFQFIFNFYILQRIYQLLPPPYRDVWLEWQEADNKQKENKKTEENKVSDMLQLRAYATKIPLVPFC